MSIFNLKNLLFIMTSVLMTVWLVQVFGDKHLDPVKLAD